MNGQYRALPAQSVNAAAAAKEKDIENPVSLIYFSISKVRYQGSGLTPDISLKLPCVKKIKT